MKIEPNKYYKTRDGRKAYVGAVSDKASTYWRAIGWVGGDCYGWSPTGNHHIGTSALDLVAPWQDEPTEIEKYLKYGDIPDKKLKWEDLNPQAMADKLNEIIEAVNELRRK